MFIRFDVIHERDRRTNGQTDGRTLHDSIDHACIASRGKKGKRKFIYIALIFVVHARRSGMDHTVTCNYTNACLYLVSVHQMAPSHSEVADI